MTTPRNRLQFELTTLRGAEIAARFARRDSVTYRVLFETGVPKDFLVRIITADETVSVFEARGIGPLLRFATAGRHYLTVDPGDGRVVLVMNPDQADHRKLEFVNSSLPFFVETTRVLTERFPYEYWNEEYQEEWYAEDDLAHLIASVEPLAYAPEVDGVEPFWHAFVPYVCDGQCSQEAILGVEWTPDRSRDQ